eukprot:SAG31_NODE_553_length_14198_cov_3.418257_7_plen_33_part_01
MQNSESAAAKSSANNYVLSHQKLFSTTIAAFIL